MLWIVAGGACVIWVSVVEVLVCRAECDEINEVKGRVGMIGLWC